MKYEPCVQTSLTRIWQRCLISFLKTLSGSSGSVVMIHLFKSLKAAITLADAIYTQAESKAECCQIFVSITLKQNLYFDQKSYIYIYVCLSIVCLSLGYCKISYFFRGHQNFQFQRPIQCMGFLDFYSDVHYRWNVCEGNFCVTLSELWKFPNWPVREQWKCILVTLSQKMTECIGRHIKFKLIAINYNEEIPSLSYNIYCSLIVFLYFTTVRNIVEYKP